jgi:subtilisin family serine protease
MKQKHIILRTRSTSTRDPFRGMAGPSGVESGLGGLAVDVDDIDRSRIPALASETQVVAIAPVIPMKLIAPVQIPGLAAPAADAVTWGVKAVRADTSPFSGNGIIVAVLDTGIDAAHPAFAGVDIVQKDFTGEGDGDNHGHGTHCAGTIFGRPTDATRIGVAPGVKKALIGKVLGADGGSSVSIATAIQWAVENGANVISMSLGMDFPGFVEEMVSAGLPTALATSRALEGYRANVQLFERLASLVRTQEMFGQATVIIAAAGNESRREVNPEFEISVSPPAVSEGVISVAALGESPQGLTVARFSNTGANVSGPGVGVISAKRGGGLISFNGTSMAAPHVAGVAALWAEKIRSGSFLTALQLTGRLIGSATADGLKVGQDSFDFGAGLIRAPQE